MDLNNLPLNPFVGLRPFFRDEGNLFFGRDQQISDLLQALEDDHFIVIAGESGSGKTSLVQAGLIPRLRAGHGIGGREAWLTAVFSPGEYPLHHLAQSLLEISDHEVSPAEVHSFAEELMTEGLDALTWRYDAQFPAHDKNVLLVADQFEDVFHAGIQQESDKSISAFFSFLTQLAKQQTYPFYVLIILRSDFREELSGRPGATTINRSKFFELPPMSNEQLQKAMREPFLLYHREVPERLIYRLLSSLKEHKYRAPLLQYIFSRHWEAQLDGAEEGFSTSYPDQPEQAAAVISAEADSILARLTEHEQKITGKLFRSLIYIDDKNRFTSHPMYLSELPSLIGYPANAIARVIDYFYSGGRAFLFISEDVGKNDLRISLCHESLPHLWTTFSKWMREEAESRKLYLQIVEAARRHKEGRLGLLKGPLLLRATDWVTRNNFTRAWAQHYHADFDDAMAYVQKSRRQIETEETMDSGITRKDQPRSRKTMFLWSIAIIIMIAAGFFIFKNYVQSDKTEAVSAVQPEKPEMAAVAPDSSDYNLDSLKIEIDSSQTYVYVRQNLQDSLFLPQEAGASAEKEPALKPAAEKKERSSEAMQAVNPPSRSQTANAPETNQMAEMFWNYANRGLKYNDWLRASHFFALSGGQQQDARQTGKCLEEILRLNGTLFLTSQIMPRYKIYGVNFSHNEKQVVVWLTDHSAQVWNIFNGAPAAPPLRHNGDIWGAVFSPDDRKILTWGADSTVRLWNSRNGKEILKPFRHSDNVNGAAFSKDGRLILSWSLDGTAKLWNPSDGTLAARIMRQESGIKDAKFSHDQTLVSTLGYDGTLRIWKTRDGSPVAAFEKYETRGQELAGYVFSHDDRQVLGWSNRTLFLWKSREGSPVIDPIEIDYGMLEGAEFSSDDKTILSWDGYRFARVWDAGSGEEVCAPMTHNSGLETACFSRNDKVVLTACKDGSICLWRAQDCAQLIQPILHQKTVREAEFSDEERRIFTWSEDGSARFWNSRDGSPASISLLSTGPLRNAELSGSGEYALSWGENDNVIKIWKLYPDGMFSVHTTSIPIATEKETAFLKEFLPLLVEVVSGTSMDNNGNLRLLSPREWYARRENYLKLAGNSPSLPEILIQALQYQKMIWQIAPLPDQIGKAE